MLFFTLKPFLVTKIFKLWSWLWSRQKMAWLTNNYDAYIDQHLKTSESTYTNVVETLLPDSFLKHRNWVYLWINSLKVQSLFLLYAKLKGHEIILRLLLLPHKKAFLKNKKRSGNICISLYRIPNNSNYSTASKRGLEISAWYFNKNIFFAMFY